MDSHVWTECGGDKLGVVKGLPGKDTVSWGQKLPGPDSPFRKHLIPFQVFNPDLITGERLLSFLKGF